MQHWWPHPHQTALRLLPFLFVCISSTISTVPALRMRRSECSRPGFSDRVFGLGVACFLWVLALQIPGSLLAENWSARRTISGRWWYGISDGADGAGA